MPFHPLRTPRRTLDTIWIQSIICLCGTVNANKVKIERCQSMLVPIFRHCTSLKSGGPTNSVSVTKSFAVLLRCIWQLSWLLCEFARTWLTLCQRRQGSASSLPPLNSSLQLMGECQVLSNKVSGYVSQFDTVAIMGIATACRMLSCYLLAVSLTKTLPHITRLPLTVFSPHFDPVIQLP